MEENWVTEWFLWHSFRFRDNRNNKTATQQPTDRHAAASGDGGHGGESLLEKSVRDKVKLTPLEVH